MTVLGKTIITTGIVILTVSSIVWILTANWQWFAGGGVVFLGSIMAGVIISVETKDGGRATVTSRRGDGATSGSYNEPPYVMMDRDQDTRPIPDDQWTPPTTPPPDASNGGNGGDGGDAFFNPPR